MSTPLLILHENLDDKICARLRQMLLSGSLAPGQRIVQEDLARAMGVSRTPLVNALKRLAQEGLLESRPRRGIYVKSLDREAMRHLHVLRASLEPLAAGLAAAAVDPAEARAMRAHWLELGQRGEDDACAAEFVEADMAFHARLAELSGNPYLQAAMAPLSMLACACLHANPRPWQDSVADHLRVIDALEARDPDAATEAMRLHITQTLDALGAQEPTK